MSSPKHGPFKARKADGALHLQLFHDVLAGPGARRGREGLDRQPQPLREGADGAVGVPEIVAPLLKTGGFEAILTGFP